MNPVGVIARYHLRKSVVSRGFLLSVIGIPLLLGVSITIGILVQTTQTHPRLGVVDPGRILHTLVPPHTATEDQIEIQIFNSREAGQSALETGRISGLYILPSQYPTIRSVELIYQATPSWQEQQYFMNVLRVNLLKNYPEDTIIRVISSPTVTIHSLDTNRVFSSSGPNAGSLLPVILGVIFMFSILPVSEMLVGALGEEQANRTMEIMLTSLKPNQLIAGKLIAAAGTVLALILIWLALLFVGTWAGAAIWHNTWLQDIRIPVSDSVQIIFLMLTGLFFSASMLIFVGSLMHGEEEVKQASSLIVLPFMLPLYVLPLLLENPNSSTSLLFSLLPITSTLVLGIQSLFMEVTWGKILAAAGIQMAFCLLFTWLAAKAFRRGMLRYGQRVRLSELFASDTKRDH